MLNVRVTECFTCSHVLFVCCSTDGYIVCEEHEEILRAAWAEEQELQKQKEKEVCVSVMYYFV